MDEPETDVLAYVAFPPTHRAKPHSVRPLERLNSLPSGPQRGTLGARSSGAPTWSASSPTWPPSPVWSGRPARPLRHRQPASPGRLTNPALPGTAAISASYTSQGAILVRTASVPNRVVRSLLTSLERSTFEPATQLASHNPLIWRASHNRTKMAVVRLLRRKWAGRDRKRPKVAP